MKKLISQFLVFVCLMLTANIAFTEESKPAENELSKLNLASTLAAYGESENDALALASAAQIYFGVSARVLKKGETGLEGVAVDPNELLETARQIAEENDSQELIAVIDRVEGAGNEGSKGWYIPNCYYEYVWIGWYYQYRYICY